MKKIVLEVELEDYSTYAWKEKGRDHCFAGRSHNKERRYSNMRLNFLCLMKKYVATLCADAAETHYKTNPKAYKIDKEDINGLKRL